MARRSNTRTGITRYQQVYTVLSQALAEGNIGAGELLPSEPTLVRQYGVSRTTVRKALARLASEGSIVRRRGSGTFARGGLEKSSSARKVTARVLDDLRGLDASTRSTLLDFEIVTTPEFLLHEWPEFGMTALLIRRLRTVDDEAVVLATIYVPERLASLITPRRVHSDSVLVALDKLGHRAATAEQQTSAVAADPSAARHLKCPVGAALLNVRKLTRDAQGRILDYTNFVYRPDSYELHTHIDRPASRSPAAARRTSRARSKARRTPTRRR